MDFNPELIIYHYSWSADHPIKQDWDYICRLHTSWRHRNKIVDHAEAQRLIKIGEYVEPPWNSPCGYHWGIEHVHGRVILHRGRPETERGAHCYGQNHRSLGVCVIGNFDEEGPKSDIYLMAACLNVQLMKAHPKLDRAVSAVIRGHCDFSTKTCPGRRFNLDILRHTTEQMRRIS